jgi:hypothetical protein
MGDPRGLVKVSVMMFGSWLAFSGVRTPLEILSSPSDKWKKMAASTVVNMTVFNIYRYVWPPPWIRSLRLRDIPLGFPYVSAIQCEIWNQCLEKCPYLVIFTFPPFFSPPSWIDAFKNARLSENVSRRTWILQPKIYTKPSKYFIYVEKQGVAKLALEFARRWVIFSLFWCKYSWMFLDSTPSHVCMPNCGGFPPMTVLHSQNHTQSVCLSVCYSAFTQTP